MPGTSHSVRSGRTWFSAYSGTVSVTPSRWLPGSKWYDNPMSTPAIGSSFGNRSVVMPAASCRISSSRFRYSSLRSFALSAWYQVSKLVWLWRSAGSARS
ncbi:hypothetical protein D3C85_1703750 [compost metagenome]